jgi:predicted nucleic acid-binding OB-fold protein
MEGKTKNQLIDQRKNKEDKMYTDISRLVKILERIAKRVEREMKSNKYGN